MRKCPFCKEPVPDKATTCPACAESLEAVKPGTAPTQKPMTTNTDTSTAPPVQRAPSGWSKKLLWAVGVLILVFVLAVSLAALKQNHFWPFSTGTRNAAFLGTTYGMSPQEARRALKQEGAQLVNYAEYRRLDGTHETNLFDYLYSSTEEELLHSDLFMPSIELFDSPTEGRFVFRQERLESVEIYFKTYSVSNGLALVESVKSHLLGIYPPPVREDNSYVPGAFYLKYASADSRATLWVNLTEPTNLMVNLFLDDLKSQQERKTQLKERENKAFGTPK